MSMTPHNLTPLLNKTMRGNVQVLLSLLIAVMVASSYAFVATPKALVRPVQHKPFTQPLDQWHTLQSRPSVPLVSKALANDVSEAVFGAAVGFASSPLVLLIPIGAAVAIGTLIFGFIAWYANPEVEDSE